MRDVISADTSVIQHDLTDFREMGETGISSSSELLIFMYFTYGNSQGPDRLVSYRAASMIAEQTFQFQVSASAAYKDATPALCWNLICSFGRSHLTQAPAVAALSVAFGRLRTGHVFFRH